MSASERGLTSNERRIGERGVEKLLATGFTPETAEFLRGFFMETWKLVYTGFLFAILAYFLSGAYLRTFGFYIFHHFEVLDCLLYELILLARWDMPIPALLSSLPVFCTYFIVGLCYGLTAITLEFSIFLIRQIIWICRVSFQAWLTITWFLHCGLLDYFPDSLWALALLFGCRLFLGGPFEVIRKLCRLALWILNTVLHLAVYAVPATVSFLAATVSFLTAAWAWVKSRIIQPLTELLKRLALLCFQCHKNQPYIYTGLELGCEIRLLRLSGRLSGPMIQGKLIHMRIDKLPTYECISYVWGTPSGKETIILYRQKFEVSTNVYEILRQRRARFFSRLIWIDSICINQKDTKERTDQVKLMQTIYGKSAQVTMCLGNAPDADLAKMLIERLYFQTLLCWANPSDASETIMASYLNGLEENGRATPPEWLALKKLLQNPWFDRCWVVQEFTLASKVLLMYGGHYLDWKALGSLISFFIQEQSTLTSMTFVRDGEHTSTLPVGFFNAEMMARFRRMYHQNETLQLHKVLRSCIAFRATNPRDRVFALQGITEAAKMIPIDYELGIEEVLINTAKYFVRRPEALEVLQYAGVGWTEDATGLTVPSWVVDWTREKGFKAGMLSSLNNEVFMIYKAAVQESPQLREVEGNAIELGGFHIDNIKARGKTMPDPARGVRISLKEHNDNWLRWFREMDSMIRHLPSQYHTGQPRSEAF